MQARSIGDRQVDRASTALIWKAPTRSQRHSMVRYKL